ncbi:MAG: hypothetical protein OXG04_14565 [Acidobacteria bacterium]|nr:hypothetical protein [Acidobacteriota bacterium]
MHLVAKAVVATRFGDHAKYRHMLCQGPAQLRFRRFDTASIFMQAKPRDMNVVLWFGLLGALFHQLRQLIERVVEVGHLQAARVPDRERDAFLREEARRPGDRLSLAGGSQAAVEDAVDERTLPTPVRPAMSTLTLPISRLASSIAILTAAAKSRDFSIDFIVRVVQELLQTEARPALFFESLLQLLPAGCFPREVALRALEFTRQADVLQSQSLLAGSLDQEVV